MTKEIPALRNEERGLFFSMLTHIAAAFGEKLKDS